ncbi:MAG: HAMP domain-containing histidine kinase [Firmicutes bacterium]|nr:HAMP domain-containing histidine kinase [Bacillota bacterium]
MKKRGAQKHSLLDYRYHIRVKLVLWGLISVFGATLLSDLLGLYVLDPLLTGHLDPEDRRTFLLWFSEIAPTLIYFICAAVFMYFLFRPFTRRVLALSDAARSIAGGDFDVQVEAPERRDEVYQLTTDFNRMARELRRNELLRKDFVSGVSHELKTPLAVIDGYARLLQEDAEQENGLLTPDERREYTELLSRESQRLLHMCTNMLQVSRLDNQAVPDLRREFRLDEQLRRVILLLEPRWSAGSVTMEPELEEISLRGNEDLLEQVWSNLLDNALKFTPAGGRVRVKAESDGANVTVTVSDTGRGMEKEELERVFDQFYQADPSHAQAGFGLGLYIVRRIVEMHNGAVWVESAPGAGSTFTVLLPAGGE